MREEQRGDEVAGAVDGDRHLRRAQPPEPRVVGGEKVDRVGGRVVERGGGDENDARPERAKRGKRCARVGEIARGAPGQPFQFEGVGRQDRRCGERAVAEEFRDAASDIDAALRVADHRIAGVDRVRDSPPARRERAQNRLADLRLAEIARQHAVAGLSARRSPARPATHSSIVAASNTRPRQPG